ncbi:MAG: DUF177 domain-containing protein [Clostridia bacterium]|nr:DUF177 domain-containing protein [Clostridia bacterium]
MQLDLKQAFQLEGERVPIDAELDFSSLELDGAYPIPEPVKVTGLVENQNMVVVLRYRIRVGYTRACDRCLDMAHEDFDYSFSHILAAEDSGDTSDEIVVIPDFRLDLDELVREDIVLELPTKFLCSSECKGLCQKCGCNLNHTSCDCTLDEPDPRLAALRELLKKGG